MTLDKILQHFFDRDNAALEKQRDELDFIHENIPAMVAFVAKAEGLDEVSLLRLANDTGAARGMRWHEVIYLLHMFHLQKTRVEER